LINARKDEADAMAQKLCRSGGTTGPVEAVAPALHAECLPDQRALTGLVNSTVGMAQRLSMQRRCAWSNHEGDGLKEIILVAPNRLGMQPTPRTFYVRPEHEQELRHFIGRLQRFGLLFVTSMLLLTIATVMAAALQQLAFMAAMMALMGLVLIVFPFATPRTVNRLGFKTSILVVRALGVGLLVVAIYLTAAKRG
jgi:hypothetical protein